MSYGLKNFNLEFMKVLFILLLFTIPSSYSAVSKKLNNPKGINHFKDTSFSLTSNDTDWYLSPPPAGTNGILSIYRGPLQRGTQPTLTIRKYTSETENISQLTQKWAREFPLFGFDVLGIKKHSLDKRRAYILDVVNNSTEKQARQIISHNKKEFVILTCMDDVQSFRDSLQKCNSIIQSLKWSDGVP